LKKRLGRCSSSRAITLKLPRRHFFHLIAGAAVSSSVSRIASALDYPTRPVRIIAGFPPGAGVDITARLIGQWLSERLGQSFIIENRPGAGSNVATEAVVRASPDGYTLLLAFSANAINATLYDNLNFNFIRDIAPVAAITHEPDVMEVNPSVPANTVPEFIAYAKANPHRLNVASGGNGTPSHVTGELFKMMTGIDMVHVPYRGLAAALTDLLGGRVQVMFGSITASIGYLKAGKLRPLGVTTTTRSEHLPGIPAVGEFVPGFEGSLWYGIGAPTRTPIEIIALLNQEINAGLADPRLKARFEDVGATVLPGSPADFRRLIAEDTEKWAKVVKFSGAKPD
jgi:tripartite-type tricarboxylate transporter receptor subunit TctC